jgi:alpha-D-ribose 1-methylphosphonate 5-triphosphate synthase subunit PhnG
MHTTNTCAVEERKLRQGWMATLAKALPEEVEEAWERLPEKPAYVFLRAPQVGLAMVRGRAESTGESFNLGEMTMTRASVRLDCGVEGHGYVSGRRPRHAELCAVFDALALTPVWREEILARVVRPLEASARARREARGLETEGTRVEFFTMTRGE